MKNQKHTKNAQFLFRYCDTKIAFHTNLQTTGTKSFKKGEKFFSPPKHLERETLDTLMPLKSLPFWVLIAKNLFADYLSIN